MKINAIRIKNLASLEGTTEIDFTSEPLASAGIFAITGPTGAGKSTLLDALCLALYGKTPRYLQAKEMGIEIHDVQGSTMSQGDVRGILRDGTSEGFAEVDFIGTDGQNYRSTWSVRRARNKADGSLQADTIALKNTSTNSDLPGKKVEVYREIERLVGLNFEQFTRSVLLAQGDFTAFMKASKDEKSSLLEKLTGTHIYSEISKKIFEKYKNEEQILRDLNLRREGITTLSEDELTENKEQEVLLTNQISQLSQEMEALSKEISWHDQFALLQKNKDLAVINLEKANEILVHSESRKSKLTQVEQGQTTRTWNDALVYNEKQFSEQNATLLILKEQISVLELQKIEQNEQLQKDHFIFSQATAIQKEALPKLAEAKKLDILIAEKEKQKEMIKSEAELAKTKQEKHQKEVLEKETKKARLATEINCIQEWQKKFESKKAIADYKDVIVSKLSDAEKLVTSQKIATAEKNDLDEKIAITASKVKAFSEEFVQLENDFQVQQKTLELQSKSVLILPIEKIQLEKDETDRLLNATLEAQSLWNVLHNLSTEFEALRQKNAKDQTSILQRTNEVQKLKKQLERDNIAKETSAKLLEKARLSATESVENLRATLVENEPCLVCGSEEHPYILHHPQLEKVLTTLEELHQQNEKNYLLTFGESNRLEQEVKGLTTLIQQQETEITIKKLRFENVNQDWNLNNIAYDCQDIDAEEKSIWIEIQVKNLKSKQLDFQQKIKTYSEQKSQLENDKIQLDKLKENKEVCHNNWKDFKSQLALNHEKQEGLAKELLQVEVALTAIQNSLSPYFSATNWMEKWMEKPGEFVASVVNFTQEWKSKSENLELCKNQHSLIFATLLQLKNQGTNLEEEVLQKMKLNQAHKDDFSKLKKERDAIFDGKAAELMEEQLTKSVDEAQKNVELTKNKQQQNKVDLATATTSNTEISAANSKLRTEIENTKAKIQHWLTDYNLKFQQSMTLLEWKALLTFSSEWIENERIALNALEEEKTKANSVLHERTEIFQKHVSNRPSERLLEYLKILHENAKTQNENVTQLKANIGFKLKEDETNKHKIGGLLTEISAQAKITDNWSKLNDIIGSADGKKFRQIAQEHTLEVLLSFANIHLQVLTSRYKIERIPNTLGLQVVDLDMGDEIRTVYSLSGGESFLVSLALALGLASLSSSKMKVESLFIDEGFGSLDPNTLNVAMDALERLHNQGRKVGVISHVQEMTERIPVQIKVSKKASGRSQVDVIGF